MEIVRYLNGVEISKDELYSKRFITEEMKSVVNEVRSRVQNTEDDDNKRKYEG